MQGSKRTHAWALVCFVVLTRMDVTVNAFANRVSFTSTIAHHHHVFTSRATPRSVPLYSVSLDAELSTTTTTTMAAAETTTTTTTTSNADKSTSVARSWKDDGFVFGLDNSGLSRPQGRVSQLVVEGDSLQTTPGQVALVTTTLCGHAAYCAHALWVVSTTMGLLPAVAAAVILTTLSWIVADFGSGVLHWSVDNYGNGKTPIMGGIIAAFQGHHTAPWTITERGFCNNVYKLCLPFGVFPLVVLLPWMGPCNVLFWSTFSVWEILSQEFHKWSHALKSETPRWVETLQRLGLTVDKPSHAAHHLAPFEGNYCIISGRCNRFLDESGFFRRLEHVIYRIHGVEPNAWKLDSDLRARTLAGDYRFVPRRSASASL
jgi:palmitoyl-[glycerolipid] 3-(E)-desaturase